MNRSFYNFKNDEYVKFIFVYKVEVIKVMKLCGFLKDEVEFTAIEYGIIASLIAIGILATVITVVFGLYPLSNTVSMILP